MNAPRLLIACEKFGRVRDAMRKRGINAVSCDTEPSAAPGPHIRGNVLDVLGDGWDGMIAFPPCTHLAVSGSRHFKAKRADGRQAAAVAFFMALVNSGIPRWSIENPVGIMSTVYRKPDQIIQPFEYGHPESKKTCLWLNGLPKLRPTCVLELPARGYWDNQTPSRQNKLGPSPKRAAERGKTYQGIADAMADQWAFAFGGVD